MLECIDAIEVYCGSEDIASDERMLDATLRKLPLLTESSKRISEELKAAHPTVAWRALAGFRNVVVHDYPGIRIERIIPIIRNDLPALRRQISAILAKIDVQA